jgi:hypothetical protein
MTDRCFVCGTPFHPSTGHDFRPWWPIVYCWGCTRHMCLFVKGMMSRKVGKTAGFYEAAVTSVRPDDGQIFMLTPLKDLID